MANLLLIRDLCEINKIKIRELASRIGKDESTIQSMIRAGSTNTKTLEAIAEVFNWFTAERLFKETSQRERKANTSFIKQKIVIQLYIDAAIY